MDTILKTITALAATALIGLSTENETQERPTAEVLTTTWPTANNGFPEPVADEKPNAPESPETDAIKELADQMAADAKKIREAAEVKAENATKFESYRPKPDSPKSDQLTEDDVRRIAKDVALDVVLSQPRLSGGSSGTVTRSVSTTRPAVVSSGSTGGSVVRSSQSGYSSGATATKAVQSESIVTYSTAPADPLTVTTRRRGPIARVFLGPTKSQSRYYVDANGCTVDRVTGRIVSCRAR